MSWLSKGASSVTNAIQDNALPILGTALGGVTGGIAGGVIKNNLYRTQDGNSPGGFDAKSISDKTAADAFGAFGYKASPEELASFAAIYHSENGGNAGAVNAAVSNYIQTKQRFQELNANDPNQQVLADEKGFFNSTQAKAAGYEKDASGVYQQMTDLAGQAPKLFGNLSPDQIDQYLAPTRRAADQSNSLLQGQAARRGLAGSSTELNSLADAERQYRENVLSTGLQIGQQQQQQQLNIMGGRQSQLFNAGQNASAMLPGILNSEAQLTTNRQNTLTDQANYLNQLPLFLSSANPAPQMPAPTGSKNFFAPGQPGTPLAGALIGAIGSVAGGMASKGA